MLVTYRNNTIHFYNQPGFSVIIYGLSQTSIINYRDLMCLIFNIDIADEMTLSLLPLSFGDQPDPIEFLQKSKSNPPKNKAVAQFLKEVSQATMELESKNIDTSRFLTVFSVTLKSVKKVSSADVVVAVKELSNDNEPLVIERRIDPNISHPFRRKEIIEKIGLKLPGVKFSTHTFQAIIWKYKIKSKPHLCWQSNTGELTRYSVELTSFLRKLTKDEIQTALGEYREYIRKRRRSQRRKL